MSNVIRVDNRPERFLDLVVRKYCRGRQPAKQGLAAVELAVVLPVMLLFALACTDFGRIIHGYITVANAARCGAEYGSMHNFTPYTRDSWETLVRQAIRDELSGLSGFDSTKLQVGMTTTTDEDGLFRASVDVRYPFRMVTSWPGLPATTMLTHKVEMRQIR